ncbi:MAG: DUF63 family protein [Halobacteriales archaeon]|jgi:uncharacterized membrane protein
MDVLDRYDVSPVRAWLGAVVAVVVAIAVGAMALPRTVYDGFLWKYFWGPVHADAAAAQCAVRTPGGVTELFFTNSECAQQAGGAIVAVPGYTTVSTVGYMVVLLFMLVGVYFLLQRLDLRPYGKFLFALVPFMLFGGALRVVEDATDAAVGAGVEPALSYPLNTVLISPIIYGTVFVLALGALLLSKGLEYRDVTDTYYYPLGAMGAAALGLTLVHLMILAFTRDYVDFYPAVLVVVVGLASLIAGGVYYAGEWYWPELNAGTGLLGVVVLWAHAIDGVANVVASDWTHVFGVGIEYGSKHVVNRLIIDLTNVVQPAWFTAAVGDSWPFLVVKVVVATAILALFDEEFMAETPRYGIMLLGAIVAVGLGPGTRDVLRVTFAI